MNLTDIGITLLHHTYNGAGYGGGGGGWYMTAHVDPETVMAVSDVLTALF